MTGEPPPPGLIVMAHPASVPGSIITPTINWVASGLFNIMPLAVLRPGWAIGIADGTTATTDVIGVYWYWDWVHPEELQRGIEGLKLDG